MLDLIRFTSILSIILSSFQTILGIGILVLGTPILLLMNFEIGNNDSFTAAFYIK